jgi:hypothetical protein
MRLFIIFIVLFISNSCWAFEKENHLTDREKIGLKKSLHEIYTNGQIDKKQYENSMARVEPYPCHGVDRTLSNADKLKLASAIKKSEQFEKVDILQLFSYNDWKIIHINTYKSDEIYLFFSNYPNGNNKSLSKWAGAATIFETSKIEKFIIKNTKFIPKELASCFAWHVTLNRN